MGTAATNFGAGYNNTGDPRKATANQRFLNQETGDQLLSQYGQQYNAQQGGAPVNTVQGTANYLNTIEDPLAQGNGGYNASESGQIELTPEQEQNIATNAGVTAGSTTQAGVGAADRATAAAGGNPTAMAAYRARAADTAGTQAGAATTAGEIAAQQAGSAGAQAVGNARLAQQNQGLNYYSGQNTQANQNAQQANQLQETAYGTEAGSGNAATGNVLNASQTPSTSDKVIGGITGVLGALDEGTMPAGKDAVVGENGPEWVGKPNYLDMGDVNTDDPGDSVPASGSWGAPATDSDNFSLGSAQPKAQVPFWQKLIQQSQSQPGQQGKPQQPWNPTTPYSQAGSAIGSLAKLAFLDEGTMPADGNPLNQMDDEPWPPAKSAPPRSMLAQGTIIDKPTNVRLGPQDAVIPLSYRAMAKARPSMAMKKPMLAPRGYGVAGAAA